MMIPNKFRKSDRYLVLLMSVVFATATSTPIHAQPKTVTTSQSPTTETLSKSGTQQPAQAFGGQLAVFLGNENVNFSPDASRILTYKVFFQAKYLSGYPRLWDTNGNLLAVLRHENNQIKSAIFSPDGQQVLTTDDQNVRLWDRNGNLLTVFSHKDFASAQFRPDSRHILTIADRDVRLWDRRGKLLSVLQHEHSEFHRFRRAIFSSDGHRILTIDHWDEVRIWDKEGNLLAVLETKYDLTNVIFSPDGSHILTENYEFTDGCNSRLWDKEGNLLTVIRRECKKKVSGIIFSPDGNYLLAIADRTVYLWDKRGNFIKEFLHHQRKIRSLEFSPDGRYILTKSDEYTIARLWDREGNLLATLQHQGGIHSLQFSPDGRHILTDSTDKTARLWDLEGKTVAILQNKGEWISDPVFSPDGNYILAKSGNVALLWDKKGNPLAVVQGHAGSSINRAIFSPDGRYILTTNNNYDETSRLWDVSAIIAIQMQQRSALQSLEAEVSDRNAQLIKVQGAIAALSPNGQYILTAGRYHEARLWDIRGNLLTVFPGHESWINGVAFSPDSSQVLTSAHRAVRLWNREGNLLAVLRHRDLLRDVAFSPDGSHILTIGSLGNPSSLWDRQGNQLVTFPEGNAKFSPDGRFILTFADRANTARLWDTKGNLLTVFQGHDDSILGAIFSPDGHRILTRSSDKTARLWDIKGNLLTVFQGHEDSVSDAAFSPDGSRILTAGGVTARLWDTQGKLLKVLQGHEDLVFITEFSPDGSRILTAGRDKTARLWDREGNPLAIFRGHEDLIDDAEFTPDGQYIVTVSIQDDTTRLWNISTVIAAQAEQMAALRTSQANLSNQNAPQAEAALQAAIQLNQQGTVESRQQALQKLEEALKLYRTDNNQAKVASSLLLIGNINTNLGQFQTALDSYNQALPLARQAGTKAEEAAILNSLGQLYNNLADPKTALDYHNQALPLLYQLNDKGNAAKTLNNIGDIQAATEKWEDALDSYNKALIISRPAGDLTAEATALTGIGSTYIASKEWSTALNAYNQSLIISRHLKDKIKETTILNQMGKINAASGQISTAQEYYNQALPLSRQLGYKTEEANILYNQATLNRQQNNLTAAKTEIETAINIIESLRTQIASQELRQSYFARNQDYYQFYIDLLMQLHQQNPTKEYAGEALHISERARARSLLELLTEATANIRSGADPKLLDQERNLQQQLNAFEHRKYQLQSGQYNEQELNEIKQKIDTTLAQLKQLEPQIRLNSPRYADLKYPEPLNLQQMQQQVLDDDTLLLEYSLGIDRSYLWAVTKTSITSYVLPSRSEIETAAQTFRDSLTPDSAANLETGLLLSQMLLAPVANQLGNKRLLIVGDGALQSVPFAALPIPTSPTIPLDPPQSLRSGGRTENKDLDSREGSPTPPFPSREGGQGGLGYTPLLVQNEIITLPSASTVAIQRRQLQNRPTAAKTLAVVADPVFNLNDSRVAGTPPQPTPDTLTNYALTRASRNLGLGDSAKVLDRLQYTRTEAEKILALVPETKRMQALDFNASRTTTTDPNLAQYQIIHLATHGLLDPINPELSGIVLSLYDQKGKSQDGFLRLHDIFNLNLPAELVVLSACETGLGKDVKGEGLVGLTRGFMYAGSRRVVVSLWRVNDVATSEVMAKFYQKMLQEGQNPVSALRAAQLEMWKSPQWQSPYYWAAFTIQGDWR